MSVLLLILAAFVGIKNYIIFWRHESLFCIEINVRTLLYYPASVSHQSHLTISSVGIFQNIISSPYVGQSACFSSQWLVRNTTTDDVEESFTFVVEGGVESNAIFDII